MSMVKDLLLSVILFNFSWLLDVVALLDSKLLSLPFSGLVEHFKEALNVQPAFIRTLGWDLK